MARAGGPTADGTRARLITAAEALFAERGIEGVSLREINRASGARNAVAVQYHFEDRTGIIRAILEKHRPAIEVSRHALLDAYEPAAADDLRALAAALVRPAAEKLADPDGGPAYLQIQAELLNRPNIPSTSADRASEAETGRVDHTDSIQRWRALVRPHLGEDAARLHRRFTAIRFSASELGRRAAGRHRDDRLFTSHLIDLVTGLLVAPTSPETLALADARDASRQRRRRRPPTA